jgi:hypothetical protein
MNLVQMLIDQLGVDEGQAKGGAGVLLNIAKKQLSGEEFGQVANAVPGIEDMLGAAPKTGGGLGGMLGGLLGGKAGDLGQLAEAAGGFKKLGLDAGMIGKFAPIILSFVEQQGGEGVMGILRKVLASK